ncbi:MAG TPA: CHC2 zinc finger domain-containing protein [Chitinophagaceae bacterium]|nr:CHC2 zinc finger domain-containing protein [Chitinophagaceae bacterium]
MNCAEANQVDIVGYLDSIGHRPQKIRGHNYWYLSPIRNEKHASFKIDRKKNVWYDHGIGKGGSLIDFVMEFYKSNVSEALQKVSFFHPQNMTAKHICRPTFHLRENSLIHHADTRETGINILAAKQAIEDPLLCYYVKQRISQKILQIPGVMKFILPLMKKQKYTGL